MSTKNEQPRCGALAIGLSCLPGLKPQAQHSMHHLVDAGANLDTVLAIIEPECDPQRFAKARHALDQALAAAVFALVNQRTTTMQQGGAS
jgi:hypothetical protein